MQQLRMAGYLAGDEAFLVHLRSDPARVQRALEALCSTCESFVREVISLGVDGIFLSTNAASFEVMSAAEQTQFSRPYDLRLLRAAEKGG